MERPKVFTRATSGLVRELSLFDAAVFGLLYMVPLSAIEYFFPVGTYYVPGANIPLAIALAIVVTVPVYFVYAGFGSALPRAGGDYVYQSRTLHPAIGFSIPIVWNIIINAMGAVAIMGLVAASSGFSSVLTQLAVFGDNPSLMDTGAWFATQTGIVVTTAVSILIAAIIGVAGTKWYRRVQRYFLGPGLIVSTVGVAFLFLTVTPGGFIEAFNAWGLKVAGDPNLHQTVLTTAANAGYTTPAFSWRATLITCVIAITYLTYSMGTAQGLLGEVKKAGNFKKLFLAYLAAGLFCQFAMLFAMMWTFESVVGWDFMHALSYTIFEGTANVPYISYAYIAGMVVGNNPILLVLLGWGFFQSAIAISMAFVNLTRPLVAMSLDGSLPGWFGKVSKKFHSPVNAILLIAVGSLIYSVLFNFWEDFYWIVINGYLFAATAILGVTCLAAVLFHVRAPRIFKSSPVSKYGYLFPIVGAIAFVEIVVVCAAFLTIPEFGLTTSLGWFILLGSPVFLAIYWFAYRAYQKRKGIDIDLAFKEIPPE